MKGGASNTADLRDFCLYLNILMIFALNNYRIYLIKPLSKNLP